MTMLYEQIDFGEWSEEEMGELLKLLLNEMDPDNVDDILREKELLDY